MRTNLFSKNVVFSAATRGEASFIKLFISNYSSTLNCTNNDINVNYIYSNGLTLLHTAAENGRLEVLEILLNAGAHINQADINGNTALHLASAAGHQAVVSVLLDREAVIYQNNNQATPLHLASRNGFCEVMEILLTRGAYVDHADNSRMTALHIAAQSGHVEAVKLLMNKGAQIKKQDCLWNTAVDLAIKNGHKIVVDIINKKLSEINTISMTSSLSNAIAIGDLDSITLLLNSGANIHEIDRKKNLTPIGLSVLYERPEVVFLLLCRGASINQSNNRGVTPLHIAAMIGNEAIMHLLLNRGAQINRMDNEGNAALHYAAVNNKNQIITLLINRGATIDQVGSTGLSALHRASEKGAGIVDFLIYKGALINLGDSIGRTPLHLAAENGHEDTIESLLIGGAEIDQADNIGRTPLHYAAEFAQEGAINLLLSKGSSVELADNQGMTVMHFLAMSDSYMAISLILQITKNNIIDILNRNGRSPLHIAVQFGYAELVNLLIHNGASIEQFDKDGMTPVSIAIIFNHIQIMKALIGASADINIYLAHGITPLCLAVQVGDIKMINLLLENGADAHRCSDSGVTCLHLAVLHNRLNIAELLINNSVNINHCANDNKTPIDLAIENNNLKMVNLLLKKAANVNKVDASGLSPLEKATSNGNIEIISALLEYGAVFLYVRGAFNIACIKERYDIMELLLCNGAEIYNNEGKVIFSELFEKNISVFNRLYHIYISSKMFYGNGKNFIEQDKIFTDSVYFCNNVMQNNIHNMMECASSTVDIFHSLIDKSISHWSKLFDTHYLLYDIIKYLSISEMRKIIKDYEQVINVIIEDFGQGGYVIQDVEKDGNCFFRAAALALRIPEDLHVTLRSEAAQYIINHLDQFIEFSEDALAVAEDIGENGAWVDNLSIQAFADAFGVNVNIHVPYSNNAIIISTRNTETQGNIRLLYTGNHYLAILDSEGLVEDAEEWSLSNTSDVISHLDSEEMSNDTENWSQANASNTLYESVALSGSAPVCSLQHLGEPSNYMDFSK